MKMKNIMLITLLLLAILTISAVSAADDVTSDNITVNEDANIIANEEDYNNNDHYIDITEEICLDRDNEEEYDDEAEVASIILPKDTTKGSLQILNGEEIVARSDIAQINEEDSPWYIEEDEFDGNEYLYGSIYLNELDFNKIHNGDELSFKFFEINDNEYVAIESFTKICKVTLTSSNMILTEIDYEAEDVEVTYDTEDYFIMEEGWQEKEIMQFTIKEGINGKIVIYLNETLAFNKTLSELDENSSPYTIYLGDLNITQAGTYIIKSYFYNTTESLLYSYENEDEPIFLVLYKHQTVIVDGVSITVNPIPTIINGNESFITINASASADDEITIQIDGKEPITLKLNNIRNDEDGNYIIGSKELNIPLGVGEYNLNITYKGKNITGNKINLISNITITFEDGTIYNKFDDGFVFISLEDGEITSTNLEGKINITIIDNAGNIIDTIEKDIDDVQNSEEENMDARVIKTKDLHTELNGTYTVVVRYFDGDQAETQAEGRVTFKTLTSEDYGISINTIIKDKNNTAITFADIPLSESIIVEIDGKAALISESNIYENSDGTYSLKYNQLKDLTEGSHSISVYLDTNNGRIDLASGNIIVDLEENIEPGLTITIANIEEGNTATVIITTNNTFTGAITVEVANTNYTVNVVKGQGNLQINGLKASTYTATAFFKSDGIFNDMTKTTTFTVTSKFVAPVKNANVIKLTLKKVKVKKSAKKLVLKATLKINGKAPKKGTKITFTFKGKKYVGKTNAKGVAKVTINKKVLKKLKVGKKVKITAKYSTKTVKRTVKIKR